MLEFKNVTKKQGKFCLQDICFQLEPGYLLGILGPNGAGKSTLFRCMVEKNAKYKGEILFQGRNIQKEKNWFLGQCAYISEDIIFLKEKTARENMDMLGRFFDEMSKENFLKYMDAMEVSEQKKVGAMSRGQFIRFQIAFGRAHHARIYLMDEPTAGMDPVFRREFYNIIRELLKEDAMVLMTTHVQADINRNMDYICRLEHGRMISFKENVGEEEDYVEAEV